MPFIYRENSLYDDLKQYNYDAGGDSACHPTLSEPSGIHEVFPVQEFYQLVLVLHYPVRGHGLNFFYKSCRIRGEQERGVKSL